MSIAKAAMSIPDVYAHTSVKSSSSIIYHKISNLALEILLYRNLTPPPEAENFTDIFSSLTLPSKANETVEAIHSVFLHKDRPYYDPYNLFAAKRILIQKPTDQREIIKQIAKLSPDIQIFIEEVYARMYGTSLAETEVPCLGINLLKLHTPSLFLFDYLHTQLEKEAPFDQTAISVSDRLIDEADISTLTSSLMYDSFSYLIEEEDPFKFSSVLGAFPQEVKKSFADFCFKNAPKVLFTHFRLFTDTMPLYKLLALHRSFIQDIPSLHLNDEEKYDLFFKLNNSYEIPFNLLLDNLPYFAFTKEALVSWVHSLPLHLIPRALHTGLFPEEDVEAIAERIVESKELEFLSISHDIPLPAHKRETLHTKALRLCKDVHVISFLFDEDLLLYPKGFIEEKIDYILRHAKKSPLDEAIHQIIELTPESFQDEIKEILITLLKGKSYALPEDMPAQLLLTTELTIRSCYEEGEALDILCQLEPIFPSIPEVLWQGMKQWAALSSKEVLTATFLSAKDILVHTHKDIDPHVFILLLSYIGKCRNEGLREMASLYAARILSSETLKSIYLSRIASPEGKVLAHLILPMLFLIPCTTASTIAAIKKHLIDLRPILRNHFSGLMQALLLTLSCHEGDGSIILRALQDTETSTIKSNLYRIYFLQKMGYERKLKSSWDQEELLSLLQQIWQETFEIDISKTPSFQHTFEQAFSTARIDGALELYAAGREPLMLSHLGRFVLSVVRGSFESERYSPRYSKHLERIATKDSTLYARWQTLPGAAPVDEIVSRDLLLRYTITDTLEHFIETGELGDIYSTDCSSLKALDRSISDIIQEPLTKKSVEELLSLIASLPSFSPTIREDIESLMAGAPCLSSHRAGISHAFDDLLLCGTEVASSCLRIDGDPTYNECLMAILLDGKNQLLTIKNSEGKMIARRLFRLLIDEEDRPVLFLDKLYGSSSLKEDLAMIYLAIKRAQALELPLYSFEPLPGLTQRVTKTVRSLSSSYPKEYFDALRAITTGDFEAVIHHEIIT